MNNDEVVKKIDEFLSFIVNVQKDWTHDNQITADISNAVASLTFVSENIKNGGSKYVQ